MKYRLNVIIVILFVCASTNNSYGQLIPVSGGRTHPVNVLESGDIAFGWGKTGISAFYINAGQEGAYSPVDVMQVTNNGNFCFRGMLESQDTYLHLLRGNTTYARWSTQGYNSNFIAKNSIKLITNNTHEIATFHTDKVSFYDNLEVEKNDIVVRCGLSDKKNTGWIGTISATTCVLGSAGHANIHMDTNYGVYIGGIDVEDIVRYKETLKNKYKLFVKKGVLSEDFGILPNSSWADFVFDKNYSLRPLQELEEFIHANKHLPDVPSAEEIAKDGYSQHEVNKALLQKVEELTLYVIELQKKIEKLEYKK
ncbi:MULTISPECIES: hypothetical protein [Bacteroides]|uniref:hypothetical protein n=1 Tax=Bacteroides TaxID=816 RepID=UPI000E442AF9|nr:MULTISPECIES: hypothetical protein [Bacteroides]MBS7574081.1 hypothetical protein [Bacteroides propionicigenes]RGM26989.1 hypothetical protein DXC20_12265 [Bacteroides sp. OM08-17BH]HBO06543.1 hypothetical protein [Bacteroides sp.]